jgi:hypothetical protein
VPPDVKRIMSATGVWEVPGSGPVQQPLSERERETDYRQVTGDSEAGVHLHPLPGLLAFGSNSQQIVSNSDFHRRLRTVVTQFARLSANTRSDFTAMFGTAGMCCTVH